MSEIKNVSKVVLANEKIFTDAEEWLESIGVNFNNTRFGNSRRIYNNWINGDQTLNLKNLWAFAEFTDLAELARLFKDSSEIESFFEKDLFRN
ncbi:hypothetical protein GKQ23_15645 [Erwinia sp. E602]|uniref:hypothetical protein n=1 Tax=Erwinia sp. E602 TaxID=2675378 RepID=UPI001BA88B5A|nr:hypothetical protein [Erwinia sp. E602]QUG76347.1 hypothetical protein GKQ23_15645 [Erwinia sp. E602]